MTDQRLLDNRKKNLQDHLRELVSQHQFTKLDIITGYLYERGWSSVDYLDTGNHIRTVSSNIIDKETCDALSSGKPLISKGGTANVVRIYDDVGITQHGKLFILSGSLKGDPDIAIIGSSNLTGPGLGLPGHKNLELNWIITESEGVSEAKKLFEELWSQSKLPTEVNFEIRESYREAPKHVLFSQLIPGVLTYSKIIRQFILDHGSSFNDYSLIEGHKYQEDAVEQIDFRLQSYGKCLLADDVGLGKTIMGTATLKRTLLRELKFENGGDFNHLLAVVVCPMAVQGQWLSHLRSCCKEVEDEMGLDENSILLNRIHLITYGSDSRNDIDDIADALKEKVRLFVVDEAHRLRNTTNFYRLLSRINSSLKSAGAEPKYLLLTATPINNSFLDLYNLFRLTLPPNFWADKGISDIRNFLKMIDAGFDGRNIGGLDKNLDILRKALGDLMIRRDATFLSSEYGSDILEKLKIPSVEDMTSDLSHMKINSQVLANGGQEISDRLKSIRFVPYQLAIGYDERVDSRRREVYSGVTGILRSHLAKSMQSSFASAVVSLNNVIATCEGIMERGDRSLVTKLESDMGQDISDSSPGLDDSEPQLLISRDALDQEFPAAQADLSRMKSLVEYMMSIQGEADKEKADSLLESLRRADCTLVFTEYRSTANWLIDYLCTQSNGLRIFPGYPDNLESDESLKNELLRLDPSDDSPLRDQNPNYDVYILTDRYSEGKNLHKCNRIVHYDWPWNPIRKTQRQGRIVRIGSPHEKVRVDSLSFSKNELQEFADPEKTLKEKLRKISAILGQGHNNDINDQGVRFRSYFVSLNKTSLGMNASEKASTLGNSNDGNSGVMVLDLWEDIKRSYIDQTKELLNEWESICADRDKTIVLKDIPQQYFANVKFVGSQLTLQWYGVGTDGELAKIDYGDPEFRHLTCSAYDFIDRIDEPSLQVHQIVTQSQDAGKIVKKIMKEVREAKSKIKKERRHALQNALIQNNSFRPVEDLKSIYDTLKAKMAKINEIEAYIVEITLEIESWAEEDSAWVAVCTDGYLNRHAIPLAG